jgi:hypothetical protein
LLIVPRKPRRKTAGLVAANFFLGATLLHAILFMQPKSDEAQDIRTTPIHQTTKLATETHAPSFPQRSDNMDVATRAIFTSPSPQDPLLGQTEGALNHVAPMSTMSGAAFLQIEFERSAIDNDVLSSIKVDQLLVEEDLPSRIPEFEYQSRSDPDASALTALFRQVVERALIVSGTRARIEGFACGLRICVGLLADGNEQDYWKWRDAFALSPELSNAGLREFIVTPQGRLPMLRYAFSIEPHQIPFE